MLVYYINLILIVGLGIALTYKKPTKLKNGIYLTVTFGYMWLLSYFRFGIGFDYDSYATLLDLQKSRIDGGMSIFNLTGEGQEAGYVLIENICAKLNIGYVTLYGILAAFMLLSAAVFIYRFSKNVWISTFIYVTLTFFYSTLNYMRQSLALAIAFWAFGFLYKKKDSIKAWILNFIPYALIILLAATMHKAALLMLPVYFFVWLRPKKWVLLAYAVFFGLVHIFYNQLLELGYTYIYPQYRDTYYMNPLGAHFLIIPILFCVLALSLQNILYKKDERSVVLVNLVTYGFLFWSFVVRSMLLERFSAFLYFAVILLAAEIYSAFAPAPGELETCNAELKTLRAQGAAKNKLKQATEKLEELKLARVLSAAGLVIVLTAVFVYHQFGTTDGNTGFHGVFPYKSNVAWIEKFNGQLDKDPVWWGDWEKENYNPQ
ncbi:MAG TPA: EpsG family protein [Oscillospiraceae bacterium]|nr:EpsG family protein [Oscillospiraceae bacterium]HPK36518.1 EpsG family protein [Oscillospiraceae bacterium]HPR76872.1 EpsG family protein [Oscillospiraceae bacterium]